MKKISKILPVSQSFSQEPKKIVQKEDMRPNSGLLQTPNAPMNNNNPQRGAPPQRFFPGRGGMPMPAPARMGPNMFPPGPVMTNMAFKPTPVPVPNLFPPTAANFGNLGDPLLNPAQLSVWVGKIPPGIEDDFIRKLLDQCGPVFQWKRGSDLTGKHKAFGFCYYQTPEGVLRASRLLDAFEVQKGSALSIKVDKDLQKSLDENQEKRKQEDEEYETNEKKEDAIVFHVIKKLRELYKEGSYWKQVDVAQLRNNAAEQMSSNIQEESALIEKEIEEEKQRRLRYQAELENKNKEHFDEEREKERERRRKEREEREFRDREAEWEERERRKEKERQYEQEKAKLTRAEQDLEFKSVEAYFSRDRWQKKMRDIQRERKMDEEQSLKERERELQKQKEALDFLQKLNAAEEVATNPPEKSQASTVDVSTLSGTKISLGNPALKKTLQMKRSIRKRNVS